MKIHTFSWKQTMLDAEKHTAAVILIYEKTGKGNKAAQSKQRLLELKKRISDLYA